MKLKEQEKKELESILQSSPIVSKIWEELQRYEEDVRAVLWTELIETLKLLCADLRFLRENASELCTVITADDRVFERIMSILKDSSKIFEGLERGREYFNPDSKPKKENGNVAV